MGHSALRRYHLKRMKAKAMKVYPHWPTAFKWANHIKGCSCAGCGNQRRSALASGDNRLTMQERRFNDFAAQQ